MDANDTTDTQDLLSESDTSEAPRVGFVKNKVQAVSIYMLCDLYTLSVSLSELILNC